MYLHNEGKLVCLPLLMLHVILVIDANIIYKYMMRQNQLGTKTMILSHLNIFFPYILSVITKKYNKFLAKRHGKAVINATQLSAYMIKIERTVYLFAQKF